MAYPSPRRRMFRPKSNLDGQVLGVYRGPARTAAPPKVTDYRRTLLTAIGAGEIKAGQGQYVNAWRWHRSGTSITVTRFVNEFIRCTWAKVVGSHVELTDAGKTALGGAA